MTAIPNPPVAEAFTELSRALGGSFNRAPIDEVHAWLTRHLEAHQQDEDIDIHPKLALALTKTPCTCATDNTASGKIRRLLEIIESVLAGVTLRQDDHDFMRIVLTHWAGSLAPVR